MIRKILILLTACLGLYGALHWYLEQQQSKFVAHMKAEFSGFRIEHMQREHFLILHAPGKEPEGVDLGHLHRVLLLKLRESDTVDRIERFFWIIEGKRFSLHIPYFSVQPLDILQILKAEIPDIDVEKSLQRSADFERSKFILCPLWSSPVNARFKSKSNTAKGICPP